MIDEMLVSFVGLSMIILVQHIIIVKRLNDIETRIDKLFLDDYRKG